MKEYPKEFKKVPSMEVLILFYFNGQWIFFRYVKSVKQLYLAFLLQNSNYQSSDFIKNERLIHSSQPLRALISVSSCGHDGNEPISLEAVVLGK